jgi:hypothetical protein
MSFAPVGWRNFGSEGSEKQRYRHGKMPFLHQPRDEESGTAFLTAIPQETLSIPRRHLQGSDIPSA